MLWKLCKLGNLTCDPTIGKVFQFQTSPVIPLCKTIWGEKTNSKIKCFVVFMFWRRPIKALLQPSSCSLQSKCFCSFVSFSYFFCKIKHLTKGNKPVQKCRNETKVETQLHKKRPSRKKATCCHIGSKKEPNQVVYL